MRLHTVLQQAHIYTYFYQILLMQTRLKCLQNKEIIMIDLTNSEAAGLSDVEKKRLVQSQINKLHRDIKRLDTTSYIIIILAFLTQDIITITFAVLIAYLISEKSLSLETKKLKLQKQFKHLF